MSSRDKSGRRPRNASLVEYSSQGQVPAAKSREIGDLISKIRKRLGSILWDLYSAQYERLWSNHTDYEEATALMQHIVDCNPRIGEDQNRLASLLNSGVLAPRIAYPTSSHAPLNTVSSGPTTTPLVANMQRVELDQQQSEEPEQSISTMNANKKKTAERVNDTSIDLDMGLYEDPYHSSAQHQRPRVFTDLATPIARNNMVAELPVSADTPANKWSNDTAWARAQRFAENVDLSWLDQQGNSEANISPARSSFYHPDSLTAEGRAHYAHEHTQSLRDAHRFWH